MQRERAVLIALGVIIVTLAGTLGYGYLSYSHDIAATIHGSITIANEYGNPWALQFYSTVSPHVESDVLVDPTLPVENSTAYYKAILNSGYKYSILVFVSAPGKGPTAGCGKSPIPSCLLCAATDLNVPSAMTDLSYNITVNVCPPPGNQ